MKAGEEFDHKEIPATVDKIEGDAIRLRRDISLLEAVTRSAGFTAGNPGNGVPASQLEDLQGRMSCEAI